MERASLSRLAAALASAALPFAGCLNETGALCQTNANCPTGQTCQAGACEPGDGGPSTDGGPLDGGAFTPAPHRPWPQILPGDGGALANPTLVTLVAANDDLAGPLLAFGDALAEGPWMPAVGAPYGVGQPARNVHATVPAFDGGVGNSQAVAFIQAAIAAGAPQPNGQTIYLLYLPPGASRSGNASDSWGPFPSASASAGDSFAVVARGTPYVSDNQFDELTSVGSHAVIEVATDPLNRGWHLAPASPPWSGSVWASLNAPGLVDEGQLCDGTRVLIPADGGFEYERSWANAGGGGDPCLPALPGPYFTVAFAQDWYAVDAGAGDAGATAALPFTGWSTAPTPDWFLTPVVWNGQGGLKSLATADLSVTSTLGAETPATGCPPQIGLNNGQTGTLSVALPGGLKSGDFAVLAVESHGIGAQCADPLPTAGDAYHVAVVGIYVP